MDDINPKIGLIQTDVALGDTESNLTFASKEIGNLSRHGVRLAILPEMWSCGFDNPNLLSHARKTPRILEELSRLALRHEMMIAGSMPEASGERIFNTLFLIEKDGTIVGSYRKIHLFSLTDEPKFFQAGDRGVVCDTSLGRIGLMICYDLRFPELCRALALSGAKLVIVCAQWPRIRISHWDVLLRARAIENQIFMAGVNRCGKDDDLEYGGNSRIVSPLGNVLAKAGTDISTLYAETDFREIAEFRKKIPCLNERMPEAYHVPNPEWR